MADDAEVVRVRLPLTVHATTVILGALARAWPDAKLAEGGREYLAIALHGEPSGWHPLHEEDDA